MHSAALSKLKAGKLDEVRQMLALGLVSILELEARSEPAILPIVRSLRF